MPRLISCVLTITILWTSYLPHDKNSSTPATTIDQEEESLNVPPVATNHAKDSVPSPVKKTDQTTSNLIAHMLKNKVAKASAKEWASLIMKNSQAYKVDPYTILAMIQVESQYDAKAVGTANDTGLLQILPATQKYMKVVGDLHEPAVNIEVGSKYLAYTQKRFGRELGIVAYNQGEGNVAKGNYSTKYLEKVNKTLESIERHE
ncbi:lytic transglycosylase domain-containing protein [Paenibacillus algorifonticola]|uniref:lytic transglycosylase domain-containing protein n=1 Tax=Paenibacillus algorifonticola TaxID=684063 RepID=UPI003D2A9C64